MGFNSKNLFVVVFLVAVLVAVSGCTSNTNMTKNSTNNTNNVVVNNSTQHNTTNYISASKAKELAQQYTAMGVTLGEPTLTTYNGVKVWKVPVNTVGTEEHVDFIYINAVSGKKVQ